MGLFDILTNPDIQKTLTQLAGKAQATLQDTFAGGKSGSQGGFGGFQETLQRGAQTIGKAVPNGAGGLVGAGALGALIGAFMPKTGTAAGMLGLGAIAWSFYRKWASENGINQPTPQRLMDAGDPAVTLMLRAMVYAARADGTIDSIEEERIRQVAATLSPGTDPKSFSSFMSEPLDPLAIARDVQSKEQGEDVYRLSCIVIDIDHFLEESYLAALSKALGIPDERAAALREEARKVKQDLARYA
ncbi:MAG: DUF533 domain-containing protein [Desulfovibrionaceae bacterium]|nr:DUF533 domain-containing protein [Desulfovibrionaceae bacterium]